MSDLQPGDKLGGYEVVGEVAAGGMGKIYKARQPDLDRVVAIKVISGPRAADEAFRKRFRREALHIAAVDHPNVIPIYGVGETSAGEPFLVMRFVDGTDLAARVAAEGPMEPKLAVPIVEQIARALDASHQRGLIHRDVKPANVLLSGEANETHAYLTDFGLTKELDSQTEMTLSGEWFGTAGFASPEQIEGGEIGPATDIYALGCVLYFCLAGEQPFAGQPAQIMWSHVHDDLPRLPNSVPHAEAFDAIVDRATAKDPAQRLERAGDLGSMAIEALSGREPQTVPLEPLAGVDPTKPMAIAGDRDPAAVTRVIGRRRPWRWLAGLAAAVGVAALAAAIALGAFSSSDEGPQGAEAGDAVIDSPADDAGADPGEPDIPSSGDEVSFVRTSLDPQSGATAQLPRGERSLESFGELRQRTRIDLPNGAVLVVDYTPQDTPTPGAPFSTTGQSLSNDKLGVRASEYVATDCEEGPVCIDYPLDLGGFGFGVLGAAGTRQEARTIAQRAAKTLDVPASTLVPPDVVKDCVSEFAPNVSGLSVRNMGCAEADDLTRSVIGDLQAGTFTSAGFSCQILGDYGPPGGGPILGASDIRCAQGDRAFRLSFGD